MELAKERNKRIYEDIERNVSKVYSTYCFIINIIRSKITSHSKSLLDKEKQRYDDYLSYQCGVIKNELQLKFVNRQHKLENLKQQYESQVKQNEDLFKVEHLYIQNMSKVTETLKKQIVNLAEKNSLIEKERTDLILQYQKEDEKNMTIISNLLQFKQDKLSEERERQTKLLLENSKKKESNNENLRHQLFILFILNRFNKRCKS